MLIVNVHVNTKRIDTILIHNTGRNKNGIYEYEVLDFNNRNRLGKKFISHKRDTGYRPLLKKVLTMLENQNIGEM